MSRRALRLTGLVFAASLVAAWLPGPAASGQGTIRPLVLAGQPASGMSDLSLQASADAAAYPVGGPVSFSITVTNAGPDGATGVRVAAVLSDGLAFDSASASQGAYQPATGLWQAGTVAPGGQATLQIVATATRAGARTLTAEVSDATEPDPDSTPANGLAGEDDQATVSVTAVDPPTPSTCGRSGGIAMRCSFAKPLPPDVTPPTLTVFAPASLTMKKLLRGLTVSATPSERASVTFELLASARKATLAAARDLTLAFEAFPAATEKRTVRLKPTRALLGEPRKAFRLRLRINATDIAGNVRTITESITVKPPKKKKRRTSVDPG